MNIEAECRSAIKALESEIMDWLVQFTKDALDPSAPLNHAPTTDDPWEGAPVTFLRVACGTVNFDEIADALPDLIELLAQRKAWLSLLQKTLNLPCSL